MPPLDQIVKSIEARLTELNHEIATLRAARGALDASASASTSTAAAKRATSARRTAKAGRRRAARAASVEVLIWGKLEAMLLQTPDGLSAITISKRANAGYNQVRDLLRELEASGHVRRTGTRRSSRWQVITEEEQIAERAAELARLSAVKSDS